MGRREGEREDQYRFVSGEPGESSISQQVILLSAYGIVIHV